MVDAGDAVELLRLSTLDDDILFKVSPCRSLLFEHVRFKS